MPAMHFTVRWPDGSKDQCYSPSTAIEKYFVINQSYPLEEFVRLAVTALDEASRRVEAKFGYFCSSAMDQSQAIQHKAQQFAVADAVVVEKIEVISH